MNIFKFEENNNENVVNNGLAIIQSQLKFNNHKQNTISVNETSNVIKILKAIFKNKNQYVHCDNECFMFDLFAVIIDDFTITKEEFTDFFKLNFKRIYFRNCKFDENVFDDDIIFPSNLEILLFLNCEFLTEIIDFKFKYDINLKAIGFEKCIFPEKYYLNIISSTNATKFFLINFFWYEHNITPTTIDNSNGVNCWNLEAFPILDHHYYNNRIEHDFTFFYQKYVNDDGGKGADFDILGYNNQYRYTFGHYNNMKYTLRYHGDFIFPTIVDEKVVCVGVEYSTIDLTKIPNNIRSNLSFRFSNCLIVGSVNDFVSFMSNNTIKIVFVDCKLNDDKLQYIENFTHVSEIQGKIQILIIKNSIITTEMINSVVIYHSILKLIIFEDCNINTNDLKNKKNNLGKYVEIIYNNCNYNLKFENTDFTFSGEIPENIESFIITNSCIEFKIFDLNRGSLTIIPDEKFKLMLIENCYIYGKLESFKYFKSFIEFYGNRTNNKIVNEGCDVKIIFNNCAFECSNQPEICGVNNIFDCEIGSQKKKDFWAKNINNLTLF